KPLEVGATLVTKAGERRRVSLADGSVLYVNQNSKVTYRANRKIDLDQGEVYLEVTSDSSLITNHSPTFTVKTPARTVSALGTRFGVQADGQNSGVIVTQGKVKVSGVNDEIVAGQQLPLGKLGVMPAPR